VKHLHKVLENHRTAIRNIRRDVKETIDKLEKEEKDQPGRTEARAGRDGKDFARGNQEDRGFVGRERERRFSNSGSL